MTHYNIIMCHSVYVYYIERKAWWSTYIYMMMEYVHIYEYTHYTLHLLSLPTPSSSAQKLQRKSNFLSSNALLQSQISKHILEGNDRQNFSQKFSKVILEGFPRKKFSQVNSTVILCMGWLRWVGCLKIYVSLQNIGLFCRSLLQKRPIFLSILLIVATP